MQEVCDIHYEEHIESGAVASIPAALLLAILLTPSLPIPTQHVFSKPRGWKGGLAGVVSRGRWVDSTAQSHPDAADVLAAALRSC